MSTLTREKLDQWIDLFEPSGYDPYNHVGRQVRRLTGFRALNEMMMDKVFVMNRPTLDKLFRSPEFMSEMRPKPRFTGVDFGIKDSMSYAVINPKIVV